MSLIGVFDSGVGGLTVLRALAQNYPGHDFVYLADTARLPYGTKSPQTISNYLDRNVAFLEKRKVDFVVVACNSASTVLMDHDHNFKIPVFNVIDPGATEALTATKSGRVGVLGTRATVLSQAYPKCLKQKRGDLEVFQAAAPLLVPLVEEGWVDDPLTSMVVYRYVRPLLDHNIDTLILGCTHYPVLKSAFQKVCGSGIELVDSPRALDQILKDKVDQGRKDKQGSIEIYCTDLTPHLEQLIPNLLKPLPAPKIQMVDI